MKKKELISKEKLTVAANGKSVGEVIGDKSGKYDITGVYILYDENDDIKDIGSAYSRTIRKRLADHLGSKAEEKHEPWVTQKGGLDYIRELKVCAIEHIDLEQKLLGIANIQPKLYEGRK